MQKLNKLDSASFDDEYLVDLSKLWQLIRQSWRLIALITFLCGALALILAFVLPKQWEARGTIHIGRTPLSNAELGLIEQPSQTTERIKLREFKERVLNNMNLPIEENVDDRSDMVIDTLRGTAVKGTEFVNLAVRGYSTSEAEGALKATVEALQESHRVIVEPFKRRLVKEMEENNNRLKTTQLELSNLSAQMTASGTYRAGSEFAPSIVAINLLAAKESEVRQLKAREIQLDAQLASFDEQATKVINKIQVAKRAVFPKRSVFLALGLFFGFLLGLAVTLLKSMRTNQAA